MEDIDCKQFYKEENLSSMKFSDEISMEFIYKKIKENTFSFNDFQIEILREGIFRLNYKGKILLDNIFEEPITIEYKNKRKTIILNIINMVHLKFISVKYKIMNPVINCETCKKIFNIQIYGFKMHKGHKLFIEESFNFTIIPFEEFKNFFNKEEKREKGFLGKEFRNPEEFEKNFCFYIKDYDIYKNRPFIFYDNKTRREFIIDLTLNITSSSGKVYSYFGQSGMGKSISILAITKYNIDHKNFGTLYLNMKCLNSLLKTKKYKEFRQLIIDEIPYLFYEMYDDYLKCINHIQRFIIENEDSLWVLVSELIDFIFGINDEKIYIFVLDQYNNKIDKNCKLNDIKNEYIQNLNKKNKQFGIITFSSMNNTDIKEYKIKLIENKIKYGFQSDIDDFKELTNIFDENELKFEYDLIDDYFESLGRNIKYYNILEYNFMNQKNMDKLIDDIKMKINKKIKSFYDCDKDEKNIQKLLCFSTETKYDLIKFSDIVKYVPFKYFIPKVEIDAKGNKNIYIDFAFPLIEEIVNEFLESIIYFELNIYKNLGKQKEIDGGARDQMFKKFVTHQLTPNINDPNRKIFFDDIRIIDIISLKKFIPRKNEVEIKAKKKKLRLKNGTYLFTQRILNGKAFDILIIAIDKNNNAKIVSIQITIHKPPSELFINTYLKDLFMSLKKNLNKFYDFKIELNEMFFVYIFDESYKKINAYKFQKMIEICEVNNVSYMLFDPENINFCDKEGKIIKSLREVVKCPFIPSQKRFECDDSDIIKDFSLSFPKVKFKTYNNIQPFEIQKAINILKSDTENGNKIKNLKYIDRKLIETQNDFEKNIIYFGRRYEDNKAFMVYFSKKRNVFYNVFLDGNNEDDSELEKSKYSSAFDLYKIIKE